MKKRIVTLTAMVLVCPIFLSGCWDRKEINDIAFVLGTAIDKEGSKYRTSVQIAVPRDLGGSSGKSGGGKGWYIESKLGKTIRLSSQEIQSNNSRTVNFSNRRSLIIGEELAREGISTIMDVFTRTPQNRLLPMVAVTEGFAYKILDTDASIEQFPTEMVRELILNFTKEPISIKTVLTALLSEGIDPVLPILKVDESVPPKVGEPLKNVRIAGLAIFKGDRMVGTLKGDMVKIMTLSMNQNKNLEMSIPAPEGEGDLVFLFKKNHARFVPVIHGDNVTMKVLMHMEGAIVENASNFSPSNEVGMGKLEKSLEDKMHKDITKMLDIVQHQYQADSVGFGEIIHQQKPKDWDRLSSRWKDIYPHVKVEIETDVQLKTVGQALQPMGLRQEEIIHD
ncbi:Ger(x)C family spore germination protein [Paenibacillus macquariensis]|nr:Ger(x)C family spore germination protein [Paenibacillus macquariensis]MEC0092433.1 Ger(x)C family spore germination protein [Paenibacillus macquariensis]